MEWKSRGLWVSISHSGKAKPESFLSGRRIGLLDKFPFHGIIFLRERNGNAEVQLEKE